MGRKLLNITGRRFGMLLVLGIVPNTDPKHYKWLCFCDCGKKTECGAANLLAGKTVSCGHFGRVSGFKHGYARGAKRRTYGIWAGMIQRCTNPKTQGYGNWGGRGIRVCERWLIFENFLSDVGEAPPGLTIERIDNNGNYEPGNVRWATRKEQANNNRRNVLIDFANKTQTISEWADELGVKRVTLTARINRGWAIERAFTQEIQHRA